MAQQEKYILELFGQRFPLITNDGNREDLVNIAEYFKSIVEQLAEKCPDRPQLDIAVLAGIKITDELYSLIKHKNENANLTTHRNDKKVNELIESAIKRLEVSLNL